MGTTKSVPGNVLLRKTRSELLPANVLLRKSPEKKGVLRRTYAVKIPVPSLIDCLLPSKTPILQSPSGLGG